MSRTQSMIAAIVISPVSTLPSQAFLLLVLDMERFPLWSESFLKQELSYYMQSLGYNLVQLYIRCLLTIARISAMLAPSQICPLFIQECAVASEGPPRAGVLGSERVRVSPQDDVRRERNLEAAHHVPGKGVRLRLEKRRGVVICSAERSARHLFAETRVCRALAGRSLFRDNS
jgi:hypothetical protein